MSTSVNSASPDDGSRARGGKSLYVLGGATALFVALASIADIAIGFALGGDLSKLPGTAVEGFFEFRQNPWLRLDHLDLLNATTTLILVTTFLALYAAHRRAARGQAALAMVIELIGTAVFVVNNAALPMLALSARYAAAATGEQRTLIATAGEALLARGGHGTPGVFPGFLLLSIAGILMSLVILKGRVLNRATGWTGILCNSLPLAYVVLVTFILGTKTAAKIISMPGGLLAIAWLILIAVGVFRLGRRTES